MGYQVLARKYRPQKFKDVVGQEHVTRTLTQSFSNDRLGHAYIFSGPRGIGKTTTARLLAKLVNCSDPTDNEPCDQCQSCEEIREGRSVDVMEIDGASNNSVDQIRNLRENVQYAPAHNRKKIYIIDEIHMLSNSAFNALLKTLEEPPDHVIFIFATTEIEQVPDTILSRCQRYDFRLIPLQKLVHTLEEICEKEEIPVEESALFLIARFAEGSLRDAQSILDQMINFTGAGERTLTEERVSETWGLAPYDELLDYLRFFRDGEADTMVDRLHQHVEQGHDLTSLLADLTEMIRNLTLLKEEADPDYLKKSVPAEVLESLVNLSRDFTSTELHWTFSELVELHDQIRTNSRFQLQLAEVGLIRIIRGRPRYNLAEITERLEELESQLATPSPQQAEEPTGPPSTEIPDKGNVSKNASKPRHSSPTDKETKKASTQQKQKEPTGSTTKTSSEKTPSSSLENPEQAIPEIVDKTPQPVKAYLRESESITVKDNTLVVRFAQKWKNHAKKLRNEEQTSFIREACEEVLQHDLEPKIIVAGEEESRPTGETEPSKQRAKTDDSPPANSKSSPGNGGSSRLLEQTKEIFDVKKVEKIEES